MKKCTSDIINLFSISETVGFLLLFLFSFSPLISQSAVITVPGHYSTIQSAINAAAHGDEIIVSPGTYYENIHFRGKNIILRSTDPTSQTVVTRTIIDGNDAGSVVTFSGTELTSCVLSGFTITAGYSANGGGICGNKTGSTLQNNIVTENVTYGYYPHGGGGGLNGCNGTIQNNTIFNNSATNGGGLYQCHGVIQNNTIFNNSASHGGGLYRCDGVIQNNFISGNMAIEMPDGFYGSGGALYYCDGLIHNNTVYGNSAAYSGGGLYYCTGMIRNCIIWHNWSPRNPQLRECSAPSYCCIQNWSGGGTGNIWKYPLMFDPENGQYDLDNESPCVDAGCYIDSLAEDFEGDLRGHDGSPESRGDGSDFDIGADEFIATLSNHAPYKPTNILPANRETQVSLPPRLESSSFSDPDAQDTHTASQWQIDNNVDFSSPIWDGYTDLLNKTSIIVISKNLVYSRDYYYWRVRHRDNQGYWSEWSDPTSFLTILPDIIRVPDIFPTIRTAIDFAMEGDEVIVLPGTYYENVNFNGKNIILRSTDPTSQSVIASTIIDGNKAGSVVTFSGDEETSCVLSGFTITNGKAIRGGGIFGNGTRATIERNNIQYNKAQASSEKALGGGLHDCDGKIEHNLISSNQASGGYEGAFGGGLYGCDGTVQYNTISANLAEGFYSYWADAYSEYSYTTKGYGGGLAYCSGTIKNNGISDNKANHGGGLYECDGTIHNNVISNNTANAHWVHYVYRGSTTFYDTGYCGGLYGCDGTIQNNTISNNSTNYRAGGLFRCNGGIYSNIISNNYGVEYGGGLHECHGIIQNNTISGNSAEGGGGLYNCEGIIQNNLIKDNVALSGGGLSSCDRAIWNNIIEGNKATHYSGGGLYSCGASIYNNVIFANMADYCGGGLFYCNGIIQNNTIWGNSIGSGAGGGLYDCNGPIRNCIIWYNVGRQVVICSKPSYSCIQNWTGGGTGNITEYPQLADPGNGDFHLLPSSSCIDAGSTTSLATDFEGDPRPYDAVTWESRGDGSDIDIGADEFIATIEPTPTPTPVPPIIAVPQDCPTIQAAINAASDGNEIIVSPGRYRENIKFCGKNIILRSTEPTSATVVSNTIIDGNGAGSVVTFDGTESAACILSGFTITNGAAQYGAGIRGMGTHATIQNNYIIENASTGTYGGYGAGLYWCNGLIRNNTISDNSRGAGLFKCHGSILNNIISNNNGGLAYCDGFIKENTISGNSAGRFGGLYRCNGTITANIISDNTAQGRGGGLCECNGTIQNNIISGNAAGEGGGLYHCKTIIQNNVIVGNSAVRGGGLNWCYGPIRNCIIWQNTASSGPQLYVSHAPHYSCIQNWTGDGYKNITSDPQFVDPANGDFHLKPTSPCIDAGMYIQSLMRDFEGDPRPMNGTSQPRGDGSDFDIGADEYPEPTLNPIRNLIRQYYNRILNRAPKISAIDAWEGYFNYTLDFDVGAHFIAGDIGRRFFVSDEYLHRNCSREQFIRDCYRAFLLRNPSEEEVAAWLNGSWSRDEAISIFVNSNEFMYLIIGIFPDDEGDAVRNFIATMYRGILERLVDGGAVDAYDGFLRETTDKRGAVKWIAKVFFGSDEYVSKNPTNRDRVICLYRGLLGRFPSDGEISYWEEELNSGRATLEELIDIFCNSEEFTARLIEFFGTAGPSTTENIDHIYEEIEPSPAPSVETPVTRVPDWEYY